MYYFLRILLYLVWAFQLESVSYKSYLSIFAIGLLAHGLLVINDGSYGDGWFIEYLIRQDDWAVLKDWYSAHGAEWIFWIYKFLEPASSHVYKGISLLCLLIIAFLNFKILAGYTPLSEADALRVSLFALIWPFFHILVWTLMLPVMICGVFFYLGWFLLFYYQRQTAHFTWYGLGLILTTLSFQYQAFLPYHLVFVLIYFFSNNGFSLQGNWVESKPKFLEFFQKNWILIIVPFVFYGVKSLILDTGVKIDQYNTILISLKTPFYFLKNIVRALTEPFVGVFYALIDGWWIFIPVLLVSIILYKRISKDQLVETDARYLRGIWIFGLLMIMAISLGHSLTEKTAKLMSIKSRHVMFAGMGAGLVLLGGIRLLMYKLGESWRKKERLIFVLVLASWVVVDIYLYLNWQARWAKDRAIAYQLERQGPLSNTSIYFLRDRFPLGVDPRYDYNDFTFVRFWRHGRRREYLGVTPHIQRGRQDIEAAQDGVQKWENRWMRGTVALKNFDPKGCMAEVVVSPKNFRLKSLMGLRYLWFKWFYPDRMNSLFEGLVNVEMRSLKSNAYGKACD